MHCWPTRPWVARRFVGGLAAAVWCFTTASAIADCDDPAGRLLSAEGVVERRGATDAPWLRIEPPAALCAGDMVAVRPPGRAAVQLKDGSLLRLDENSTLHLLAVGRETPTELGLLEGLLHVITRMRKHFTVTTPFVNALVEGTEFSVASDARGAQVVVESGRVRTRNRHGSVLLPAGAAIAAGIEQAPSRIEVRPLDALRWAIHYPQIVWHADDTLAGLSPRQAEALRQAQESMAAAHFAEALARLGPDAQDVPALSSTRISLLLALGRVDDALSRLGQSPAGTDAEADALRAVIEVARNQPQAIETARAASTRNEHSAAARLALSYARQARGELDMALAAAREASRLVPTNPFAWARRAELELSLARSAAARRSLAELNRHAPQLPRARTLLGFAQLIEGQTAAAQASFDDALAADDADWLAYFGRGLAAVRSGNVEQGRSDTERAVLLDPGNAELRAYLARVYVEEDRSVLAGKELDLARRLDPASPTPWQFDALRKLRDNDPIGALSDGRRAIALNDNRAVLRPPGLLDIDRAARHANLGAAYSEIGFSRSQRIAANDSLVDDPGGSAGHRLLAESYAGVPRFESARLSESLLARLRKPIGQQPMAPQQMLSQLPIVGGSRALTPDEGADLFERGPAHLSLSATAGSQSTRGLGLVAAHSTERSEVTLGHFNYARDAAPDLADIDLRASRIEFRHAPSVGLMLLAEASTEDRNGGSELEPLLAGVGLQPILLVDHPVSRDTARISLVRRLSDRSEGIVTAALQDIEESSIFRLLFLPFLLERKSTAKLHAREVGTRLQVGGTGYSMLVGAAHYRQETRSGSSFLPDTPLLLPSTQEHNQVFARATVDATPWLQLELGARYDILDDTPLASAKRPSAGAGIRLRSGSGTSLRVAAFNGVKGPKYNDQSLEPSQFAGFNRVFDDFDGTRWRRLAIALEHRLNGGGTLGAMVSRRKLEVPGLGCGPDCRGDWNELAHEAFVEVPFDERWALFASLNFESLSLDGDPFQVLTLPYRVRTTLIPVGAWVRVAPSLSARLEALQVRQKASIAAIPASDGTRRQDGWLANAKLSYARRGRDVVTSLAIFNAFDRRFDFQDNDLNGNPQVPRFHRERTVLLQASVRF